MIVLGSGGNGGGANIGMTNGCAGTSYLGGGSSIPSKPTTVAEMQTLANSYAAALLAILGPRSSVVVMIGTPIDGQNHDRFAAVVGGPCLSSRGLLAWGERSCVGQIDAGDSSLNGKAHP